MAAVLVTVATTLPLAFTAVFFVQMGAELGFGVSGLGIAVSLYFGVGAIGSVMGGVVVERIGPKRGLRIAALGSILVLLLLGLWIETWVEFLVALSIAGLVHAVAQPAVNTTLAMATSSRWKASVFGLKQAAVPGAYMLAGLSASISPWGDNWRLAFLCGVGVALVGTWFIQFIDEIGRLENHEGRPGSAKMRRVSLVWLVAGGGFGAAAGNCLGSFLLTSLVVLGVTQATAGLVVGLSSAIGVGTRIVAAWTTDLRRGDGLGTVVSMLGVGTIGFVLLATQQEFIFLVLGSLLAFAMGWGWPGVYQFLVVNSNRGSPAKSTGFAQLGTLIGAACGPLIFGFLAERFSLQTAWSVAAAWSAIAAVLFGLAAISERENLTCV